MTSFRESLAKQVHLQMEEVCKILTEGEDIKVKCSKCGWEGTKDQAELASDRGQPTCPKCGEPITTENFMNGDNLEGGEVTCPKCGWTSGDPAGAQGKKEGDPCPKCNTPLEPKKV